MSAITLMADIVILNMFLVVCCLPVVTVGAAVRAPVLGALGRVAVGVAVSVAAKVGVVAVIVLDDLVVDVLSVVSVAVEAARQVSVKAAVGAAVEGAVAGMLWRRSAHGLFHDRRVDGDPSIVPPSPAWR